MVMIVKSMIERPCFRVSVACLTASRASTTPACCCLRVRRSFSCKVLVHYNEAIRKGLTAADVLVAASHSELSSDIRFCIPVNRLSARASVHLAPANCSLRNDIVPEGSGLPGTKRLASLGRASWRSAAEATLGSKICRMCLTNDSATICCWSLILVMMFNSSRMSFTSFSSLPSGLIFNNVFCAAESPGLGLSRELWSLDAKWV